MSNGASFAANSDLPKVIHSANVPIGVMMLAANNHEK
jgi:hypothetical protein